LRFYRLLMLSWVGEVKMMSNRFETMSLIIFRKSVVIFRRSQIILGIREGVFRATVLGGTVGVCFRRKSEVAFGGRDIEITR
jgi:hypothetical protein